MAADARGDAAFDEPPFAEPSVLFTPAPDHGVTHSRVLQGGRLALLEQPNSVAALKVVRLWWVEPGGARRVVLEAQLERHIGVSLLTPTTRADPSGIVLAANDPNRAALAVHLFSADGKHVRSGLVKSTSPVNEYSVEGDVVFVHGDREDVGFEWLDPRHAIALEPVLPQREPANARVSQRHDGIVIGGTVFVGRSLATPSERVGAAANEELIFCDLALRSPPVRIPLRFEPSKLVGMPEALWLSGPGGVFRATPETGLERVFAEPAFGLMVRGGEALVGARTSVVCLEVGGRRERYRTDVGHPVYALAPAPAGGCIASSLTRFTWLDASGSVRATSGERNEVGSATLQDGTMAVSAGEEVLVIGPDGVQRRRLSMGAEGQIIGATASHFIYGKISGGVQRRPPQAVTALDAAGNLCDRVSLERTDRGPACFCPTLSPTGGQTRDFAAVLGDSVALVRSDGVVVRWNMAGAKSVLERPAPLREVRDLEKRQGVTYSPRDDWAEPGVDVAGGAFFAARCSFGGTTGVCPGPALLVHDCAVATLFQCRLTTGELGELRQASTAVLIECQIDGRGGVWQLARGCHLMLLDCTFAAPIDFILEEGASVVAPGCELVRQRERVTLSSKGK